LKESDKKSAPPIVAAIEKGRVGVSATSEFIKPGDSSQVSSQVSIQASNQEPPANNMGARCTIGLRAIVDWFTFTLDSESIDLAFKVLGITQDKFIKLERGMSGYTEQWRFGNIVVLCNGSQGMGVHVFMTGQGCRAYEGMFGNAWKALVCRVKSVGGHFTRIDAAVDDYNGMFTIEQIRDKVEMGEVRTVFKGAKEINKYNFCGDGVAEKSGGTIYFGSTKSNIQIRFYDKAKEQGVDYIWNRVEVQSRDERANAIADMIGQGVCLGEIVLGVLKRYVNFVEPCNDSNKARWKVSGWWDNFLGEVKKLRLSIDKARRTITDVANWVERQVAPSLALLRKAFGESYGSFYQSLLF
jgi:phage replication initiation protein